MKLPPSSNHVRRPERGFFLVIVLLAITALMLIYLTANARHLAALKQDLRLVEQKQIKRLHPPESGDTTNGAPVPSTPALPK